MCYLVYSMVRVSTTIGRLLLRRVSTGRVLLPWDVAWRHTWSSLRRVSWSGLEARCSLGVTGVLLLGISLRSGITGLRGISLGRIAWLGSVSWLRGIAAGVLRGLTGIAIALRGHSGDGHTWHHHVLRLGLAHHHHGGGSGASGGLGCGAHELSL